MAGSDKNACATAIGNRLLPLQVDLRRHFLSQFFLPRFRQLLWHLNIFFVLALHKWEKMPI
jgi:hypothetical protein